MFVLGHMGLGQRLVRPLAKGLPILGVLLGTVLPDLIDKPLYYLLVGVTGLRGADLGLISGTRTFGHTGLFLLGLWAVAYLKHSRFLAAVALGVASHLLLDQVSDLFRNENWNTIGTSAIFWPVTGWSFPVIPYRSLSGHWWTVLHPVIWGAEVVGAVLLVRLWSQRNDGLSNR